MASLSFSSRITRWAIFLPMPGAQVRAFSSPVMMDRARLAGVVADRMDNAAFGPTPETEMSWRNRFSSSWVPNPNSSIASSRVFRWVNSLAFSPCFSLDRVWLVVRQA